jgi:hypothetical protein
MLTCKGKNSLIRVICYGEKLDARNLSQTELTIQWAQFQGQPRLRKPFMKGIALNLGEEVFSVNSSGGGLAGYITGRDNHEKKLPSS